MSCEDTCERCGHLGAQSREDPKEATLTIFARTNQPVCPELPWSERCGLHIPGTGAGHARPWLVALGAVSPPPRPSAPSGFTWETVNVPGLRGAAGASSPASRAHHLSRSHGEGGRNREERRPAPRGAQAGRLQGHPLTPHSATSLLLRRLPGTDREPNGQSTRLLGA